MSAFIVCDRCLYEVCEAIYPFTAEDWQEPTAQALLLELANLNSAAVNCRYSHHNEPDEERTARDLPFDCVYAEPVRLLKSLDCWLYQCDEGERFTSSPIYRRAETARNALAQLVGTRESAAYDNAPWG